MQNNFTIHLLQKYAGNTVLTYCGLNTQKMKTAVITTNAKDIVSCMHCKRKFEQRQHDLRRVIEI